MPRSLLAALALLLSPVVAAAQDYFPTLPAVYPSGGAAGTTVEVDLRLSSPTDEVREVIVTGCGVTARTEPQEAKQLGFSAVFCLLGFCPLVLKVGNPQILPNLPAFLPLTLPEESSP